MPSRVSWGNSLLIPAPLVGISKQYLTTGDGTKIGSTFNITVNGVICADRGSPTSSGTLLTDFSQSDIEVIDADSRLGSIIRKQEAIRDLFSVDGLSFEVQSADGSQPLKCNPRVLSIDFAQDIWYHRCDYTITLEADRVSINGLDVGEDDFDQFISSAEESWTFEADSERGSLDSPTFLSNASYRLSHTLNATGKKYYDETGILVKEAWEQARDWVINRLGINQTFITQSGVYNLPDYYGGYNHNRTSQTDELGGVFNVTENWILASGTAIEDFNINITSNTGDPLTKVSVNGTVTGLDEKDANMQLITSRFDNAELKWLDVQDALYTRAKTYAGIDLNPVSLGTTVGKNPMTGIINYTYDYDNRPSNNITGALSESISMNDSWDVDIFAIIGVPGRTRGPVLQNINTKKEKSRSLNLEVVFDPSIAGSGSPYSRFKTNHPQNLPTQSGDIQAVVDAVKPDDTYQIFLADQQSSWDGVSRYTLQVNWIYEQ